MKTKKQKPRHLKKDELQAATSNETDQQKSEPAPVETQAGHQDVVVVPVETGKQVARPQGRGDTTPQTVEPPVHVAPDLIDLVTGVPVTPAEIQVARQQRDLNEAVHRMLVVGLAVSTVFMVVGLGLDLLLRREVPTIVPDFTEAFGRVAAMRPSGFLALGLLTLIATPILRVMGSIVAFLYERNWHFAGITFLVFMVIMASVILGAS